MDYRDLENLGQQMSQKIRDAVDSLDFENLKPGDPQECR